MEQKDARILEESKQVSLKESFEVGSGDLMKGLKMMRNWLIQCLTEEPWKEPISGQLQVG